jgi:peptide/nickel transport system substrate-binding protein
MISPSHRRGLIPSVVLVSALAVGGLIASGCTSGGSSSAGATASKGGSSTSAGGPSTTSSASGGTGKSAVPATVTIGLDSHVGTLDPDKAIEPNELAAIGLIAGTLTATDPSGQKTSLSLAQSQDVSSDGLTYTYKLKSGLKYSDGTPVVAGDYAASVERSINDKANRHAAFFAPITSVEAPDAQTVVFHLKAPYASLPTVISQPEFAFFPASKLTDAAFFKAPISNGPYVVKSFPSDTELALTVNPNYAGGTPVIHDLVLQYIQDPGTRVAELKSGQIQYADDLPSNTLSQVSGGDLRVEVTKLFQGIYLYVNDRNAPLSDVNVRQAISMAIDRDKLNQIAYSGKSSPLLGFLPDTMTYHEANLPGFNLAKAKALIKQSSCASGCSIKIQIRNGLTSYIDIASVLQQQLKEIGINATLNQIDPSIAATNESNGSYQTEVNGLLSRADFPDGFLDLGLLSTGGIHALYSGYASPTMDSAIGDAIANSGDKRKAAMSQVNVLFAKDLPHVPLLNQVGFAGTSLPSGALTHGPGGLFYVSTGAGS